MGSEQLAGWHLYGWGPTGSLGAPGFQTLAASPELAGDRLAALERLVAGARPAAGSAAHRNLLLQPLPTDRGRVVLTRVAAHGRGADGRPGDFRAVSLVAPEAWLERSGWNLEAAFRLLERQGERDQLPAGPLPSLPPAQDERGEDGGEDLARLRRLVPDPELRLALLETLAWQAEDGGRDEPLYVVAAPTPPPKSSRSCCCCSPACCPPRGGSGAREPSAAVCGSRPTALPAPSRVPTWRGCRSASSTPPAAPPASSPTWAAGCRRPPPAVRRPAPGPGTWRSGWHARRSRRARNRGRIGRWRTSAAHVPAREVPATRSPSVPPCGGCARRARPRRRRW